MAWCTVLALVLQAQSSRIKAPRQSDKPINIGNEESITNIESFEGESAQAISKKCSNFKPLPEAVQVKQFKPLPETLPERGEVQVRQSFLEEAEVAEIFGVDRSATSTGISASENDYECDSRQWRNFVARFSIPKDANAECNATEKLDFQDGSACREKNVLYLYPAEDHNGAFCINDNVCHRMNNWYSYACSVHMKRASSVKQAIRELKRFRRNSLKHAVLGGHGSGSTLRWGEGDTCGESHLCINSATSESFLEQLSEKMHPHGSIFLDSCLSSTTDEDEKEDGMNMGEWVAKTVGKGIRVIGSMLSFGEVQVVRFAAWYAQIDVEEQSNVQVVHLAQGARCPDWAESQSPDEDGDCKCPDSTYCELTDGSPCPQSEGETSDIYFLPMCAESWSNVSCRCV